MHRVWEPEKAIPNGLDQKLYERYRVHHEREDKLRDREDHVEDQEIKLENKEEQLNQLKETLEAKENENPSPRKMRLKRTKTVSYLTGTH